MRQLPPSQSCFVCGRANPIGLKLKFATDGETVRAPFTADSAHAGFRNVVHGGIVATLLDEAMAWACGVKARRFAYCAEMNVRYLQPARPGEELTLIGALVQNRRNRILEASAELRDAKNTLLASATGKYIPIPESETAALLAEFEDGGAAVFSVGNAD